MSKFTATLSKLGECGIQDSQVFMIIIYHINKSIKIVFVLTTTEIFGLFKVPQLIRTKSNINQSNNQIETKLDEKYMTNNELTTLEAESK